MGHPFAHIRFDTTSVPQILRPETFQRSPGNHLLMPSFLEPVEKINNSKENFLLLFPSILIVTIPGKPNNCSISIHSKLIRV